MSEISDLFLKCYGRHTGRGTDTVVRIVGWTKNSLKSTAKRRSVYVEEIPLITQEISRTESSAKVNEKWLANNKRSTPIFRNSGKVYTTMMVKFDGTNWFLKHKDDEYYPISDVYQTFYIYRD